MEGDFRRPSHSSDGYSGGQPRQQPSHHPPPPNLTDLRPKPQPQGPAPHHHAPAHHQAAHHQTPHHQPPALATPVPAGPRPASTAELIARHERESAGQSDSRRGLILAIVGVLVLIAIAVIFLHPKSKKSAGAFPASISKAQVTIPVYYPKNLPDGFRVGDYKVVKQDVLNYAVTNKNNDTFYVNIQPVPAGYDFAAFNKRFTSPATYQTSAGQATIGVVNNELIASIRGDKSWVLINSTATKDGADMATVAKSLQPTSL